MQTSLNLTTLVVQLRSLLNQRPIDRQAEIVEFVNSNAYEGNPYAKEFGIHIRNELVMTEARILPTPWLKMIMKQANKRSVSLVQEYDEK